VARRKISLQNIGQSSPSERIDDLVRGLGTADLGFSPTDQAVYEVDIDRIKPDPYQPRYFLPSDLREKVNADVLTPSNALHELLKRAEEGDQLATLILGGQQGNVEEDGTDDDDKGLAALANSIREVGLRQPINVYTITNPDAPGETSYRVGEGERRYWAHHLLVLQGHSEFSRIRCIIERLPDDEVLIRRRQQAENAARQDLSAIARARSIQQIRERLRIDLGTRVPGGTTIKFPSQRELDATVGQEVGTFTGRAIGGRMVRNYLRLLTLSPELQDLAEAAQLTEKHLRPILRLKSGDVQRQMIEQIINEKLSGRAVLSMVKPAPPVSSLRQTTRITIEERLRKRLLQAAMTVYEIRSMGEDVYLSAIEVLTDSVADNETTKTALLAMHQLLDDLTGEDRALKERGTQLVNLSVIAPPLEAIVSLLPERYQGELGVSDATGVDIMQKLVQWRQDDPLLASVLNDFFAEVEGCVAGLKDGALEDRKVILRQFHNDEQSEFEYKVLAGKCVYWASV